MRFNNHVPQKRISGRHHQPWITGKIQRLIKQKQRQYNKAKRSQKDEDWQRFKHLRKTVQKESKSSHSNYLNNIFQEEGSKGMWRYIKSKRKDSSGVSTLVANGKVGTEPKEKAEMLNDQFTSVFTQGQPRPPMPKITVAEAGVNSLLRKLYP